MALTSLKLTKKEIKKSGGLGSPVVSTEKVPQYPWGLRVSLEKEALEKLDISYDDFEIDQEVFLKCKARVSGLSKSQRDGGDESECVDFQIEKMEVIEGDQPDEDELDWDTPGEKANKRLGI